MSNLPVVCVTIPMYNDADVLDATVQSVLTQDYEQDKIILLFADFGSTDGTIEKILRYRREWAGVFDLRGRRIGRTMKADAVSMWKLQSVPGRPFLLRPGDIVYPHCFKTAALWYRRAKRQRYPVAYIVGEADIREKDGTVRRQTPLFTKPCRLLAYSEDSYEYVKKGYRHAVLPFGRHYSIRRDKVSTLHNYGARWNTLAYTGFCADVLYIDEALGCLRAWEPDDELDEILFSFEQLLTMCRATRELPDTHVADARFEPACRAQLAKYALWRAFLLYVSIPSRLHPLTDSVPADRSRVDCPLPEGRGYREGMPGYAGRQARISLKGEVSDHKGIFDEKGRRKEAEDCFLMARIISPPIAGEECRRHMETLLETGDTSSKLWLAAYFSREEAPDTPKWPVGGMFTHIRQLTRRWFSGEKKSKFSDRDW